MKSPKHIFLALMALGGVNALLAVQLLPEPTPETLEIEAEGAWKLPSQPEQASLDEAYQAIRTRQPWGEEPPPEQQGRRRNRQHTSAPKAPAWRFAGVVYEGDTPYMLVEEGEHLQRYAEGEELPDTTQVVSIGADVVEVEKDEERETLRLYQAK